MVMVMVGIGVRIGGCLLPMGCEKDHTPPPEKSNEPPGRVRVRVRVRGTVGVRVRRHVRITIVLSCLVLSCLVLSCLV